MIVVGAGAGLSEAAGLSYSGERFTGQFRPFIEKYGLTDMYSAGFYPFKTEEERWAYWARHIIVNRLDAPATELYGDLMRLLEDRSYFVITTNVDGQFERAGISAERLFATQGDYRYLQCASGCHAALYDDELLVREMASQTVDCRIPGSLVPKCPICGDPMAVHLRCDQHFVEDRNWHAARERYHGFLQASARKRVVFFELGVGYNTPGIIRFPFERMTGRNPNAVLIRLNRDDPMCAAEIADRTIVFCEEMKEVIDLL